MNFYKQIDQTPIPVSGVALFATEVKGYTPSNMLSFIDLTNNILDNNPEYNIYETIQDKSGNREYMLPEKFKGYGSGSLIVTDKFTRSKYVDYTIPLFYQYQFQFDHYPIDSTSLNGFIILRKNMDSIVDSDNYIIQSRTYPTSSGRYNTDLTNVDFLWDKTPTANKATTVRLLLPNRERDNFYTVEYNKYVNGSITEYYNELVYEQEIYLYGRDYVITPSSIILPEGANISPSNTLYVQKTNNTFIKIKEPSSINDTIKDKPWNAQINCGAFVQPSKLNGSLINYKVNNYYSTGDQVIYDEIPTVISKNVIRTNTYPLHANPIMTCSMNGYDMIPNITSIDNANGYIYINQDIKPNDSILLTYKYDDKELIRCITLELNPIKSKIDSEIDIALDSIGVAIVPSGTAFLKNGLPVNNWSNIAYYKLSECPDGNFDSSLNLTGYALENVTSQVTLGVISGVIPSNSKLLGYFTLNSMPSDMLSITDIRQTGGYISNDVKSHSTGWRGFSDIGFWDGEAFPTAGTIIIQIPTKIKDNIKKIFENTILTTKQTPTYAKDLTNIIDRDVSAFDSIEQQITNEVNAYIRDTIERYLPLGTLYIIVDEDFEVWPSIRSDS